MHGSCDPMHERVGVRPVRHTAGQVPEWRAIKAYVRD